MRLCQKTAERGHPQLLGYSNLEYDLQKGCRGERYSHFASLICRVTGAEDCLAVNNNAAAVLLMLSAVGAGKQVIVSRGEQVEIGGKFRIPDIMDQSGCKRVEVGTTNKTRCSDYEEAITEETAALLKVHTSNFAILGFTESVIRFLSPAETIGGGVLLNELAPKHRRKDAETMQQLKDREEEKNSRVILAHLARFFAKPAVLSELAGVGMEKEQLVQEMDRLADSGQCVKLTGRKHIYYWTIAAEEQMWEQLREFLGAFHQSHPFLTGIKRIEIKNSCFPAWDAALVDAYLSWLLREGRITTDSSGTEVLYARSDFQPVPDEKMKKFTSRVLKTLQKKGMDLVEIDTLKADNMSAEEFSDRITYLEYIGKLVHVTGNLYMTPRTAAEVQEKVENYFSSEEKLSYGSLRDILGTSRKSAKPMMLWLDAQGLTSWCCKETERTRGQKCGNEPERMSNLNAENNRN